VVAVALLVALMIGCVQYVQVYRQHQAMMDYVVTQQNQNVQLREDYRSQIDLVEIRNKALALGMVPRESAPTITIRAELPQRQPEPTAWEDFVWLCKGLFA
jgi:phosphoglycerate-specific signal transduction histidine kinase